MVTMIQSLHELHMTNQANKTRHRKFDRVTYGNHRKTNSIIKLLGTAQINSLTTYASKPQQRANLMLNELGLPVAICKRNIRYIRTIFSPCHRFLVSSTDVLRCSHCLVDGFAQSTHARATQPLGNPTHSEMVRCHTRTSFLVEYSVKGLKSLR